MAGSDAVHLILFAGGDGSVRKKGAWQHSSCTGLMPATRKIGGWEGACILAPVLTPGGPGPRCQSCGTS